MNSLSLTYVLSEFMPFLEYLLGFDELAKPDLCALQVSEFSS